METYITPPQTTIRMLGGMMTPMTEEQRGDGHREALIVALLFHGRDDDGAFPAASAVEEPEIPPKIMLTTILT